MFACSSVAVKRGERRWSVVWAALVGGLVLGGGEAAAQEVDDGVGEGAATLLVAEEVGAEVEAVASAEERARLFVSVRDLTREPGWSVRTCWELRSTVADGCVALPGRFVSKRDQGVVLARRSGRYRYHLRLERDEAGALQVEVVDWDPTHRDDEVLYAAYREPGQGGDLGWVARSFEEGLVQSPAEEVEAGRGPRRYDRAALEVGLALGVGTAWYWLNTDINSADWDYTLATQGERHWRFEGWRWDSNAMYLNTPLHPLAGGAYYTLARANELTLWQSFAAAMLATVIWEAAIEYKEIVSLNDLVLTGVAGVPLGEAYYQLGEFFRRSSPTRLNQALAWVFGAPSQFHDWADGRRPVRAADVDRWGWPVEEWHRLRLRLGAAASTPQARWEGGTPEGARQDVHLEVGSELVGLGGYRRAGVSGGWEAGVLASELRAEFAGGASGTHRWGFLGRVELAGWYGQSLSRGASGGRGVGALVSTGLAYRHEQHRYDEGLDRFGIMHLPGVRAEHWGERGRLRWRLSYGVTPDFAAIDSRALPVVAPDGDVSGQRGVLAEGYYFGWGFSQELGLEVDLARVHLGAGWRSHRVWSTRGADRLQASIDEDWTLTDRVDVGRVELLTSWPVETVRLGALLERRGREGAIDEVVSSLQEWRAMWVFEAVY
ncbi:DUF3943 domain-containing protein [Lujinxingia vulgaris]|uniref:DUF3943 domain-containing protein n=1 Tax=Lujinxingia vulgaris TaxID=2600176 RepID=A0A5C6XND9_9DELT|nr:DUF3943 domain-containing protein [Lujinxingia vulgaris]TXD43303.1 DUF3943 domain-containing protein [Lujinxingia vulgaris]